MFLGYNTSITMNKLNLSYPIELNFVMITVNYCRQINLLVLHITIKYNKYNYHDDNMTRPNSY